MIKGQKSNLITVGVVLLLGVLGFYLMSAFQNPFASAPAEEVVDGPEISFVEKKLDGIIAVFLKEVNDSVVAYKAERKVLLEAINPASLRETSYVEENYKLIEELVPKLQLQLAALMKKFEDTEAQVAELLVTEPQESRDSIMAKWNELKRTQGRVYAEYFASEDELLASYRELMSFYYEKRGAFVYDASNNTFVFQNPEDAAHEKRIEDVIKNLQVNQAEALKKPPPPLPDPSAEELADEPAEEPVEEVPAE